MKSHNPFAILAEQLSDADQRKLYFDVISKSKLNQKDAYDAFLSFIDISKFTKTEAADKKKTLETVVNTEANIIENFTNAFLYIYGRMPDTKKFSDLIRPFRVQKSKQGARTEYMIVANPSDPKVNANEKYDKLTKFILSTLKPQSPKTYQEDEIDTLNESEKAILKYIAFLNKVSERNATEADLNINSYMETDLTKELMIRPNEIMKNIKDILKLDESNTSYSQQVTQIEGILLFLVKYNSWTFSNLVVVGKIFLEKVVELANLVNQLVTASIPKSRPESATPRSSTSSAPKKEFFAHVQNVVERLDPQQNIKLISLFKYIHKKDLDDSPNPKYIDYLDIWKPQHTYNAIFRMQGNPDWNLAALSKYRVIHFLHHFRVCLEILHLIHFRMADITNDVTDENIQKMKDSIYTKLLTTNEEKTVKPFDKNFPLLVYAGWDMQKVESKKFIEEIGGFQLLQLNFGAGGNQNIYKYTTYYGYIDKAFADGGMKEDRIDTLLEVLCLVFSVNYKLYKHGHLVKDGDQYHLTKIGSSVPRLIGKLLAKPKLVKGGGTFDPTAFAPGLRGQQMVQVASLNVSTTQPAHVGQPPAPQTLSIPLSDSRNTKTDTSSLHAKARRSADPDIIDKGPVPDFNSIYCYITNGDIKYLREVYEKHCILIVQTLIYFGVTSFHVPFPPKEIETILTPKGPTLG